MCILSRCRYVEQLLHEAPDVRIYYSETGIAATIAKSTVFEQARGATHFSNGKEAGKTGLLFDVLYSVLLLN